MRTLLVDDSPVVLQSLKAFLKKHSECELAQDGQQGLEAFNRSLEEQRPYNLICLDLQMPEMDGLELLRRIRSREQELELAARSRVLVITATADATTVRSIMAEGADGYLLKPITQQKILEYLAGLGLILSADQAKPQKLMEELGSLCAADGIPAVLLIHLMRQMAGSLERQSLRDAGAVARAEAETKAAREALAKMHRMEAKKALATPEAEPVAH